MYFGIGTISDVPVYRFPFWLNLPNILFFGSIAAQSRSFLSWLLVISQGLFISPDVDYSIITRKILSRRRRAKTPLCNDCSLIIAPDIDWSKVIYFISICSINDIYLPIYCLDFSVQNHVNVIASEAFMPRKNGHWSVQNRILPKKNLILQKFCTSCSESCGLGNCSIITEFTSCCIETTHIYERQNLCASERN